MNEQIPAPYDHTSGQRTMAQAMRELNEFRAIRKPHDLGVLPVAPVFKRGTQVEVEPVVEVPPEVKEVKKNKKAKRDE